MGLRTRLNLLISLSLIILLIASGWMVIGHSRNMVAEETESTANFAMQMLEVVTANRAEGHDLLPDVLVHLSRFEKTRHLHIEVIESDGSQVPVETMVGIPVQRNAPDWFARLVKPERLELQRVILRAGKHPAQLIVTADPTDEIEEAWGEASALMSLLALLALLVCVMVYFSLGTSLKPINGILTALERVEKGDYRSRLPETSVTELNQITRKFNHMVSVLEQSREQNLKLAQRSLAIQEQERRYLAQEMHDELGQSVSAIQALAVSIKQNPAVDARVGSTAQTISDTTQRVYDVVRGMMRRLRPTMLDELGLLPALQKLVDDWNEQHQDTFCQLNSEGNFSDLNEETRIHTFRIVQEALTNVVKHAHASDIKIDLSRRTQINGSINELLDLHIRDNGIGLPVPLPASGGLGISGMRERAEALGGSFHLSNRNSGGTHIAVQLPVIAGAPATTVPTLTSQGLN